MNLYGNTIWNNATPNSEKAILITTKEHLDAAVKALDETGANYCYYIKENRVTIAFAKISVSRSELDSLMKIPELSDMAVEKPKGSYTPNSSVIGNTAYRDIGSRHYQKLETDLALKVAEELEKNGIHYSGKLYGKTTTITVDSADRQELEHIISDVVNTRSTFKQKIKNINGILGAISELTDSQQISLKSLVDMCYAKGEVFSDMVLSDIANLKGLSIEQTQEYSALVREVYGDLNESEYIFADISKLIDFRKKIEIDRKFAELTYLKGFSSEQKEAFRQLIEKDISESVLKVIDYDFSPQDILAIPDIFMGENGYNRLVSHIAAIKHMDEATLRRSFSSNIYQAATAQLDYYQFDIEHYSVSSHNNGSLYSIPIETTAGLLNRLAEYGITPNDELNQVVLETDNGTWNKLVIPDRFGNKYNNINLSEVLIPEELSVVRMVIEEVVSLEQTKQLAHENGMPFSSKYSEDIDDEDNPYVYDSTMSSEDFELRQSLMEEADRNLEQIVSLIGEKGKTFTKMVNAGEFSKAGEILKEISVLTLQAEKLKAVIQQEAITTEDVDKLREIEPKRKSVQNMLETEVAQTPKFERLLGEELGEKSPYEMRRGNLEWREDSNTDVEVITLPIQELPKNLSELRKAKNIERGTFINLDTGINVIFGMSSVNEIIAKSIQDSKRGMSVDTRVSAMYHMKNLIAQAVCFDSQISEFNTISSKNKSPNTLFMHQMYDVVRYNEQFYLVRISIEEAYSTDKDNKFNQTLNRVYNLKDIKITPVAANRVCDPAVTDKTVGEDTSTDVVKITIPQLYEIVKEYDHSFYENEQSPGRAERLEEIQAQEDFQSSVEVLQSHISQQKQAESPFDKSVRLINEYCERVFDTKANFSNLDHVDLAFTSDRDTGAAIEVYADLEAYRIVAEYGGKTAREMLFSDLDEMNIALESLDFDKLVTLSDEEKGLSGVMTDKELFFSECNLAKLLAKSSLAWDEIESLGYIFFEQGYIDKFRPTSGAHYGNGGLAEPDAYELARRYQSGEDISKELVKNLFETRRGTIPQTEIPFEDSYLEDLRLQISQTDTGYLVFYGGYSREVTFEEMAQAYLTYFKNELADIQKAVAEEEAHTNAQKTIKELGYEVDTEKDKFFFTPYGVEEIYFNPNSSEGGQFVISQISYEDILEAEAATINIDGIVPQTTAFFEQLEGNSNQTAIDITSNEFGAYAERFNQPYDLEGGNTSTMYELTSRAREQIEQRNNIAAPKQEEEIIISDSAKYRISATDNDQHKYNVQLWVRSDDGEYIYSGNGKYFETLEQAKSFITEKINEQSTPEQTAATYKIYQIKSGEEYHYKRFEGLERQPEPVNVRDYDLVYQGSLSAIGETTVMLESLFDKFNTDHPADFTGHSLSVSDVIVIEKDGEQAAYFCDSIGYKELPDFFKEIERPQTITSENRIETVDLKKESVQPKEEQTVSVPEESPQLSFDVTSTIPAKNEPDNTVLLDLNEYDDPDYYEQQQIAEQEAAEVPNPENFRITDSEIGSGTPLQRFNNNLAAIRLLKDLEADGRQASPEEQETLSRYVGWGGLAEFFKESNPHYQELRDLLTEDEYSSARATTLDSFYTSPVIIDSIYTVLQNSGFEGGNILEPSMGIGNFFGRMPQEMQSQSKLFGVEIDSLTGRIAKQLYPEAHIDIKGFEKTSFKNGSFDVAVGNIPFGDFSLQYDRQSLKIHDYFFMQALDKVKDGGIVAFVTSKGTLDKRDSSFRRMLAEKADLIGAVRLPNTAFKTAGTEVTADIIFLQKRQSPPEKMPDWVNIGASAAGLPINEYFVQHPEMVLGEIVQGNKMYGRNNDTMCVPFEGRELSELLPEAVSRIHAVFNAGLQISEPMQNSEVQIPEGIRNYSYFEYKSNIYTIEDNEVVSLRDSWKRSYSPANIERAKAYIQIRDTVRELLAVQQETAPDAEDRIRKLQAKLNTQYDSFYKKYGLMHSRFNAQLFRDDSSYPLMLSLEDKIDKDKLIRKSDIFYKRTIRVSEVVDKVDTPQEALVLSLAEKGKVDLEYMSALTDLPQKAIISDLKGDIFPVPELSHGDNIVYQTASEYLSGDIYAKLSAAKFAAENNSVFADNVPALEAAVPTPLTAGEIDIECGATWIPKEIYQQFMYETFKTANEHRADCPPRFPWQLRGRKNIEIDYSPHTNKWNITNKSVDHSVTTDKTFGTKAKNAYTIFEAVLNLHIPNITKTIPDPDDPSKDKKVMDIEATKLVKRKAEAIRKEFKDWIFKDPERRKMLVDLYNRQFNCVRPREYDGSHLQFHGMNASIELHQHQKNAIAHAIYGGNTLFAHCVGAGKTFEMIATAMESKRLGLCSKSLFVVPNHLTEQVGADFMKLYPNANILVATKKDFTKQNRRKLLARIATGNYDAVIIGHSQLGMIPLSPERQERMYKEQIEDITRGIAELKAQSGESFQVKAMERTRKSLQQKLEKLSSSKKDDTLYFEELGIDKLFVDEAHEFKNLMSVTKLQNVSGISGRTSQRATELFMKCRYLDEKTGSKGVVFATGTPVSNSITELHTMMRYLQYDFLSAHGMQNFDNWVSVFGKQKTDYELAPTGDKFKARTRIASYANMPELMTMFKQCADVRTSDSLKLPVPECELHVVNADPTPLQQDMVSELSARADDVQNGKVEPHVDNMLRITGDGRKVGLDPRLVNPTLEDNPNTKLNQCVNNVFQIWQDTAADKLTQIIFCDLGVPKPNQTDSSKDSETDEKSMADIDSLEESGTFCVYDDIKSKLVAMGIPKEEIAFIHDAKTEAQKSDLFEKVRSGEIRVLLGSTAKMGTGTNVQDRLIALHDLDVPWRPSDLEQRRGRMVRQGNINEKVHLYRYVTKGTFDAYSYQLLETKQRFISQVITSKSPARTCSDVDQEALTYSEIKALCTGDERIKEKLTLENRVKELQLFEKEYRDTHFELEDKVAAYPEKREQMCVRIEKLEQDFEKCKAIPFDEEGKPVFSMIINGTMYTDRKEVAEALKTALDIVYTDRDRAFPIGEIYGFKIFAAYDTVNECIRGIIKGELEYSVGLSTMPSVNVNKFEKLTIGIEKHLDDARKKLEQADIDIESAKAILAQPFEFAAELADKTERLADLTDELNAEAAERLQSTEKKPRTHYFGKEMILSAARKETPQEKQERSKQQAQNQNKSQGVGIDD